MSEGFERYGSYTSETDEQEDEGFSVGESLRRHYVATRIGLAELVLLGAATAIILNTDGPLGNVFFAMLVSIGVMLAGVAGLFGAAVKLQRWRRY